MEDPVKEIPGIIKAIVQNEDFKLQEQTIFRYFSDSAVLDHPIVYCKGPWEILAGYQVRFIGLAPCAIVACMQICSKSRGGGVHWG
jgi:hypothetical protein